MGGGQEREGWGEEAGFRSSLILTLVSRMISVPGHER